MKNILIIGRNSYIGNSIEFWLNQWEDMYQIDKISVRDKQWEKMNFSQYDTVIHTAGIVHKKEKNISKQVYEDINYLLAVNIYKKCVAEGVKQFIFFSTAAVYTQNSRNNNEIKIDSKSLFDPKTLYGSSKRKAEVAMLKYDIENTMKLAIIRPPMVYGKDSPGNYKLLSKIANKIYLVPYVKNARSMIYIDNLTECIRLIINNESYGIYHPQNRDVVNTSELIKQIRTVNKRKTIFVYGLSKMIKWISGRINVFSKIYGNYVFDEEISNHFDWKYCVKNFEESVFETERKEV